MCITGQVLPILPSCPEDAVAIPAPTGPRCVWGLGYWRSGFSRQTSPGLLLLCCPRTDGGSCHRLLPLQLSAGPTDQREREFGRAAWRDGEIRGTQNGPHLSILRGNVCRSECKNASPKRLTEENLIYDLRKLRLWLCDVRSERIVHSHPAWLMLSLDWKWTCTQFSAVRIVHKCDQSHDLAFLVSFRWISICQARSWCWMKPTTLRTVRERAPASPWSTTVCCRAGMSWRAWSETASDPTSTNLWGTAATVWSSPWGHTLKLWWVPVFSENVFFLFVS